MTSRDNREWLPFALVLLLLAAYAIVSRSAALTKSATTEETLHAAAGWTYLHARDWRASMSEPPLVKLASAMLHEPLDLAHSTKSMYWRATLSNPRFEWHWAIAAVFRGPAVTGDAFIQRARLPLLAFGVALGGLIALWAWQAGGPAAAIPALVLFCLSPDFIGHGSLVNGDVALAFAWLAVAAAAWALGEKITIARIMLLVLAVALALLVSFSGLMALPLAAALLGLRAAENRPWIAGQKELVRPLTRALFAAAIVLLVIAVSWVLVWCAYGLRFSATADETPLDIDAAITRLVEARLRAVDPDALPPSTEELATYPPGASARFALFSQQHGLLPEAWNVGLISFATSRAGRVSYLLGSATDGGDLRYFPIAMLVKQPLAALAASTLALLVAFRWIRRQEIDASGRAWFLTCLVLPPVIWVMGVVASRANDGMRQLFPAMPFLFLATGLVAGRAMTRHGKQARRFVTLLGVLLAIECAAAWPDYISFFNAFAGGPEGGIELLGESNLDWGQDLPLLASWQADHPQETLYLAWGGSADPTGYGIRYVNAFGAWPHGPLRGPMDQPGVLAIGASVLQRTQTDAAARRAMEGVRAMDPIEILGGTIYLYRHHPAGQGR